MTLLYACSLINTMLRWNSPPFPPFWWCFWEDLLECWWKVLLLSRDRQVTKHHIFYNLALAHRKVHLSLTSANCYHWLTISKREIQYKLFVPTRRGPKIRGLNRYGKRKMYLFLVVSSALRSPLFPDTGGSQASENTLLSSCVQSPSCRMWTLR